MLKKSTKKKVQDFFFSPVFYVLLLGVVIIAALIVVSINRSKNVDNQPGGAYQQTSADGTKNAKQMISVTVNDPNKLATSTQVGSSQEVALAEKPATAAGSKILYAGEEPKALRGRVLFKIDQFKKLAVQPLKFDLFNEKGNQLTPDYLKTTNEQKIHFYVVSANLREFQHLNPNYADGKWNVKANLPNPGSYYAYTVATTVKNQRIFAVNELVVQKKSEGKLNFPGLTPDLLAIVDGVTVKAGITPGKSGGLNTFSFNLLRDNKAVSLEPVFGSFGNIIVIQQGVWDNFSQAEQQLQVDDLGGLISFSSDIAADGRYTAFCEFRVAGRTLLFPITYDIK